jgi:hypothetical protein
MRSDSFAGAREEDARGYDEEVVVGQVAGPFLKLIRLRKDDSRGCDRTIEQIITALRGVVDAVGGSALCWWFSSAQTLPPFTSPPLIIAALQRFFTNMLLSQHLV